MKQFLKFLMVSIFLLGLNVSIAYGQAAGNSTLLNKFDGRGMALSSLADLENGISMPVFDPNLSPMNGTVTVTYTSQDGRTTKTLSYDCTQRTKTLSDGTALYFQDCVNSIFPIAVMGRLNLAGPTPAGVNALASSPSIPRYKCDTKAGECECFNPNDCKILFEKLDICDGGTTDIGGGGLCDCSNEGCLP